MNPTVSFPSSKLHLRREYVQPQWLADCINNGILLSVAEYAPGKVLPPHLSPFVDVTGNTYIPQRQLEIERLKGKVTGLPVPTGETMEEEKQVYEPEHQDAEDDEEVQHYDFETELRQKKRSAM